MGHPVSTLQLQGKIYHTVNRLRSFLSSGHSGHLSHSGHSGHSGHSFPTTTLRRPLSCVFFPVLYSDSYVHLFCQKNSIRSRLHIISHIHHVTLLCGSVKRIVIRATLIQMKINIFIWKMRARNLEKPMNITPSPNAMKFPSDIPSSLDINSNHTKPPHVRSGPVPSLAPWVPLPGGRALVGRVRLQPRHVRQLRQLRFPLRQRQWFWPSWRLKYLF